MLDSTSKQPTNQEQAETQNRRQPNRPENTYVGCVKNGFLARMMRYKPPAIVVWLALANRAKNGKAKPSIDTLQADTHLARATIIKAINTLEHAGELIISHGKEGTEGRKSGSSSRYTFCTGSPNEPVHQMNRTGSPNELVTGSPRELEPVQQVNPNQTNELDNLTRQSNQTKAPAKAGDIPAGLLELIEGWNSLGNQIVKPGNGARRDPPAEAVLSGWKRALKNPEQRKHFQDIPAVLEKIKAAKYCHQQGWFTLPWLFGKNAKKEFNIERLMAGAHEGENYGQSKNGELAGPTRPRTRELTDRHYKPQEAGST
jgi:hypothetical protein